ncbi:MAG: methyltransferase domain-containing protein [Myxococcota bacterium]
MGFHSLTRVFDPLLKWTMRDERFKTRLLDQAGIGPGIRALDLGCGTGTLAVLAAQRGAEITGVDADATALGLAREKAAALPVTFVEGLTTEVELPPGSFDRVLSSLFFHHLLPDAKAATLARAHEWLRPGGSIHIADWGRAANPLMRGLYYSVQLLDGFSTTEDNVRGLLPAMLRQAGFEEVEETRTEATVFGTLSFYRGLRPA